ncbi:MAG: hypothetical protein JSW43_02895 [Gemmatimonadota bacterium]|nr:MAG: hypothetical protein JSW43_02895 [Gemmatimonadota bacterium]
MEQVRVEAGPGIVIPRKFVIPPGALAQRMQRYAVYLIVCCFVLMLANVQAVSLDALLWFATAMAAAFALLCGVTAVILHAIQWKFERLMEDLATGGR